MNRYLVSFYNLNNRSYNVSGPNDPSASLFLVEGDIMGRFVLASPDAFRFVASPENGFLLHDNVGRNINIVMKDRPMFMKPEFLVKAMSIAKPVTMDYFIDNFKD